MCSRLCSIKHDFDIRYTKGIKNCQANALLRLPAKAETIDHSANLKVPTSDPTQTDTLEFLKKELDANDHVLSTTASKEGPTKTSRSIYQRW